MRNYNQPDTWDDDTIEFIDLDNPQHHTSQHLSKSVSTRLHAHPHLNLILPLIFFVFIIFLLQPLLLPTGQHSQTSSTGAPSISSSTCILSVTINTTTVVAPHTKFNWVAAPSNPQTPSTDLTPVVCSKIVGGSLSVHQLP